MRCFACGGPYHPASGHIFSEDVVYCGACYRPFVAFMKSRFYQREDEPDFIAEAMTSIRPPPTATSHLTSPWLNGSERGPPKPEILGSNPSGDTKLVLYMTSSSNLAQDTALSLPECGVQIPPRSQCWAELSGSSILNYWQHHSNKLVQQHFSRSHRLTVRTSALQAGYVGFKSPWDHQIIA